jgi:hypothetical protein
VEGDCHTLNSANPETAPDDPSLYGMTSTVDIFLTLIAHGMILDRGAQSKPMSGLSNMALAVTTGGRCMNPNCEAKKRTTHTTANCYWPGGDKEGQFPPNFGQHAKADIVSSMQGAIEHFVLSARVSDTPGNSGLIVGEDETKATTTVALVCGSFQNFSGEEIPTFFDSGASDTMLVSREDFTNYKSITPDLEILQRLLMELSKLLGKEQL